MQASDDGPLPDGAARFAIDRFALTANNVTYGAVGDALAYWRFYPTGDADWGVIPAWGFATVEASSAGGVAVGDRYWGYWPMADSATLRPARVDASGFVDGAPHRRELAGVYNRYLASATDPLHHREDEDLIALLRPLFATSFLIDDFLADARWFGASQILVASASSKTAWGLAFCVAERRAAAESGVPRIVGATSAANVAYTRRLGVYDEVVAYDDLPSLDTASRAVFVDMRGSAAWRAAVHAHFGEQLAYSCSVGLADWQALGSGQGLSGPRPVMFFAPEQAKKRAADWGDDGLQRRIGATWRRLVARVDSGRWLRIVRADGPAALAATWADLVDGRVPPDAGCIASLAATAAPRR